MRQIDRERDRDREKGQEKEQGRERKEEKESERERERRRRKARERGGGGGAERSFVCKFATLYDKPGRKKLMMIDKTNWTTTEQTQACTGKEGGVCPEKPREITKCPKCIGKDQINCITLLVPTCVCKGDQSDHLQLAQRTRKYETRSGN